MEGEIPVHKRFVVPLLLTQRQQPLQQPRKPHCDNMRRQRHFPPPPPPSRHTKPPQTLCLGIHHGLKPRPKRHTRRINIPIQSRHPPLLQDKGEFLGRANGEEDAVCVGGGRGEVFCKGGGEGESGFKDCVEEGLDVVGFVRAEEIGEEKVLTRGVVNKR
jgi:hypothetical protein